MKNSIGLVMSLALATFSCSRQASTPGALPRSWYSNHAQGDENPTAETDEAIRNVFKANTSALQDVTLPLPQTSWHLDGMLAEFGVSVNGIFGALLANGTTTVRGTWQLVGSPILQKQTPTPTARINANTSAQDLARELDPAISAAIASGAVRDEATLRSNVAKQSETFRLLCQAMDSIPIGPGWQVNGLQVQLTFDGSGNIVPVGIGAALNIYLDWQESGTAAPSSTATSAIGNDLADLIHLVASALPRALADSTELKSSGFVFNQFQLGLALNAQGQIGIAQAQAAIAAKVLFTPSSSPATSTTSVELPSFVHSIGPDGAVSSIETARFTSGMKRAIKMASYFAARAKEANTSLWKINQLETEFDATLGGDIQLTTIQGTGALLLDFGPQGD
jgi:hypothetical protein